MLDEVRDGAFKVAGQVVIFEQKAALEREVPSLGFTLGHRMIRRGRSTGRASPAKAFHPASPLSARFPPWVSDSARVLLLCRLGYRATLQVNLSRHPPRHLLHARGKATRTTFTALPITSNSSCIALPIACLALIMLRGQVSRATSFRLTHLKWLPNTTLPLRGERGLLFPAY